MTTEWKHSDSVKLKDHAGVLFLWGFMFQVSDNPEDGEWRSRICTPVSNLLHQTTADFNTVSGSAPRVCLWIVCGLVTVQTPHSSVGSNPECSGSTVLWSRPLIDDMKAIPAYLIINMFYWTCVVVDYVLWWWWNPSLPSQGCRTALVLLISWFSSTLTFEKVSSVYFKFIISYLHKTQREVW